MPPVQETVTLTRSAMGDVTVVAQVVPVVSLAQGVTVTVQV
ncbi:hypothetical protein [Deinococcus pimensis]|nr:hypothetical protein [Deinococcus pimensis]